MRAAADLIELVLGDDIERDLAALDRRYRELAAARCAS